jgi:hypothetical protein
LSAEQRLAARRTRTAPLMEVLKARPTSMLDQLFSHSKLAEAIAARSTATPSSVQCADCDGKTQLIA